MISDQQTGSGTPVIADVIYHSLSATSGAHPVFDAVFSSSLLENFPDSRHLLQAVQKESGTET